MFHEIPEDFSGFWGVPWDPRGFQEHFRVYYRLKDFSGCFRSILKDFRVFYGVLKGSRGIPKVFNGVPEGFKSIPGDISLT